MHANQICRAALVKTESENLALAPVLATSKLLGMIENNEEARQKPEALYQSNPARFQNNNSYCQYVGVVYHARTPKAREVRGR
jgi:hypothetical protein